MRKNIKLNESRLNRIIKESIRKVLNEGYYVHWGDGGWTEYDTREEAEKASKRGVGSWVTTKKPSRFGRKSDPFENDGEPFDYKAHREEEERNNARFKDNALFGKFVEQTATMPGGSALATFKVRFNYFGDIELDFVHWGEMSGSEKENSTTMEEIRQYRR